MADYTWFRLLVKGIGIVVLGMGMPELISHISSLLQSLAMAGPGGALAGAPWFFWYTQAGFGISSLLQIAFGLYLLFRGQWLVDRCLRSVYGRCPACDYDVRGVPAVTCPECGIVLPGRRLASTTKATIADSAAPE